VVKFGACSVTCGQQHILVAIHIDFADMIVYLLILFVVIVYRWWYTN
jgi:hypothetical protein